MPRVNVYLSDEELAFVKSKGRGYLRKLIQRTMENFKRAEKRR